MSAVNELDIYDIVSLDELNKLKHVPCIIHESS